VRRSLVITLVIASAGAPPLEAAHFAPALGWHLLRGKVVACPGVPASRCSTVTSTASTIRWRDCLDCLPHRTFAAMSAGDILIQVSVGVERPIRVRTTFAWPPRISRRQITGLEGVPSEAHRRLPGSDARRHAGSRRIRLLRPRPADESTAEAGERRAPTL
jgi:hypothetical protein